jgi:hypothetical protein
MVWKQQAGGDGLSKRVCTSQLLMSPGQRDEQSECCPALIFRGTGKRIKVQETAQYHAGVDLYWQRSAWADADFCDEYMRKTTKRAFPGPKGEEVLLFCDNLRCQVSDEIKRRGGECRHLDISY